MLTENEIELVQDSFAKVEPIAGTAAEMFYNRLFLLDPGLKELFSSDMTEQGEKLMAMIKIAVDGLNNLEEIVPAVQTLGERHAHYGVADGDYDTVGQALIWTLQQGLQEDFTDEVKGAWIKTYGLLAQTMKEAAATAKIA